MALKECRECGKKISSEAKVCPSCGVENPVLTVSNVFIMLGQTLFWIGVFILSVMVIWNLNFKS